MAVTRILHIVLWCAAAVAPLTHAQVTPRAPSNEGYLGLQVRSAVSPMQCGGLAGPCDPGNRRMNSAIARDRAPGASLETYELRLAGEREMRATSLGLQWRH